MTQLDGVITADGPTAERIRQRGIEPVTAIHNYPKTKAIAIADLDIERSHDYVFVYVGNLTPERGLFRMIDFVAALRDAGMDAGLWLLGTIDNNALERDVQSRIASEGIEDAVQLFGWVPYEDIFSYLVLADAGLLLLDADRFTHNVPTKLFEYMSIGLPIVATPTNSVQQYLPADRAVFVADGDVNAPPMGEIRAFLDGWDEKASAELKRLVEEQYSWETEVIELLSFYESLLYM
jgi:glycosyltransferase involved in cell wall biosynthesis